ncbi:TetR/AcrR family transcriptional regulator [Streptomyces bambusae]|uniref:TetR/AcrR family transcriptional regulator n=1 Tax=Streptomyces bambusae TaxID=1550616 RepID=UPI001CFE14E4|nr:TetR family transcriptional regulator [Streptomyces bambusae]MCB5168903.1 TetR/AcrR family transcriptional regulator [Streptomyces bambusae]
MVTGADPAKTDGRTRSSVWLVPRAHGGRRRSEQPAGLDREKITAASVRLLDAHGLSRFSMRRLAAGLGVTAMSLYWYVDTKDDLLELALDAALGEPPLSDPMPDPAAAPDGWHGLLRTLACGYRRLLAVHPWVSPLAAEFPNIGPHARAFDAALQQALHATGLPAAGRTGAHLAVSQFLHGCGSLRQAPEGDFRFALEVLVAGIDVQATAAAARP